MTDGSQGPVYPPQFGPPASAGPPPGWWLASDGQWYPPPQPGVPPVAYQQQWHPSAVPQQNNGMAIASMVLGILWLWWIGSVLALIFGYVAQSQIRQSGNTQGGSGMATAGIVLGWIGVGTFALFLVLGVARSSSM